MARESQFAISGVAALSLEWVSEEPLFKTGAMHIAGGIYRELCASPSWDALFGSGGRAALALAHVAQDLVLHAYADQNTETQLSIYRDQKIDLRLHPRTTPIAFAYFHPLSQPHIAPETILRQPPFYVNGDTVLRFGFLEGEAIVQSDRAVYDPQTSDNAPAFCANGSKANNLAVVLNELELIRISGEIDPEKAAAFVIRDHGASVVVVKRGVRGAAVYTQAGSVAHVPAYKSQNVFKIGTGGIFSAVFAHQWGDNKMPPEEAADCASRAVSDYSD